MNETVHINLETLYQTLKLAALKGEHTQDLPNKIAYDLLKQLGIEVNVNDL